MWSIINQLQSLILFLLISSHIDGRVRKTLSGLDFVMANFNFIPVVKGFSLDEFTHSFEGDFEDRDMYDIGYESTSALINNVPLMFILCLIILFNLCFFFSPKIPSGEGQNC